MATATASNSPTLSPTISRKPLPPSLADIYTTYKASGLTAVFTEFDSEFALYANQIQQADQIPSPPIGRHDGLPLLTPREQAAKAAVAKGTSTVPVIAWGVRSDYGEVGGRLTIIPTEWRLVKLTSLLTSVPASWADERGTPGQTVRVQTWVPPAKVAGIGFITGPPRTVLITATRPMETALDVVLTPGTFIRLTGGRYIPAVRSAVRQASRRVSNASWLYWLESSEGVDVRDLHIGTVFAQEVEKA